VKIDCIGRPAPKRYLEILNNPNLKRRDLTEIYNFE